MASGYQQQVNPGSSTPLTGPTPDEMGASTGADLAQLGNQLVEQRDRMRAIRRDQAQDQQSVDGANNFANAQIALGQKISDLRDNAAAGATGHVEAVVQNFDDTMAPVLDGITNPAVRASMQRQIAATRASAVDREQTWAGGQRVANLVSGANDALSTISNSARGMTQPTDVLGLENQYNGMVDNFTGIDGDKKAAMKRAGAQQIYGTWVQGLSQSDPSKAVSVLDHGGLNDILEPAQITTLRNSAEVAVRRQDAATRAQANQARAQALQATNLDAGALRMGRGTYDQWNALATRYETLGDPEKAQDARGQAIEIGSTEQYRGAVPLERQQRIDELAAKPELTAAEGSELKGLKGQQSYVSGLPALSRYTYATGQAVPPIDISDPASIQQRIATITAAKQHFGGDPAPLLPGEEQPIKQLIASGNRGDRINAAHAVMAFGPYSGAVLDQVAGQDHEFRSAMALAALPAGSQLMDMALQGPDAIKAAPQMLVPAKDASGKPSSPKLDDIVTGETASAMALLPPQYRAALQDNVRNLYGGFGARGGWTELHPGGVSRAIRFALGGVETGAGWAGGLGTWQGQSMVLPRGMTQDMFDQKLSRANGGDWGASAMQGSPWVPSQNRNMTAGEARGLVPVMVRDGVYALRQGNSYVTTKEGKQFQFDVRKLPGTSRPTAPTGGPVDQANPAQFLGNN